VPGSSYAQDIASRIAFLRSRAETVRRLAKDVRDSLAKIGLLEFAEECERQAATLEAEDAPADDAMSASPSRTSRSRSS